MRAYSGLRASHGKLALRAWLYRIAHNRCIDELRRPAPPPPEVLELVRAPADDPIAAAEQRESLRRLIDRRPAAPRAAALGAADARAQRDGLRRLADALGVSVPAVKSLLVRARIGLAQALEARDTACSEIREELTLAHDRGVRPSGTARRHMRDCSQCRHFRGELRGVSRRFAALAPTLGPIGVIANILGLGGGGGGGAAASSGAVAAGGAAGTGGAVASVGLFATGAGHIATLIAAAAVTAGGAVEIQSSITVPAHHAHHARPAATAPAPSAEPEPTAVISHATATDIDAARRDRSRAPDRTRRCPRLTSRRVTTTVPAGHITDPALQSPSSTTTGTTASSGTTPATTGTAAEHLARPDAHHPTARPRRPHSTTDPTDALDHRARPTLSTAGTAARTASTGTTSSSAPTISPATSATTAPARRHQPASRQRRLTSRQYAGAPPGPVLQRGHGTHAAPETGSGAAHLAQRPRPAPARRRPGSALHAP